MGAVAIVAMAVLAKIVCVAKCSFVTMLWKMITVIKSPIEEASSQLVMVVCLGDGGMAMMRVESAKPEPCRLVGMAWDEGSLPTQAGSHRAAVLITYKR